MSVRRFLSHDVARGLLLVVLTFIAYAPALRSGFVWDDALYIRDNPLIKAGDGLRRFWCTTEFTDYYALSNTSFWLEWRLWGDRPLGYHATNILLHALNALLIWKLLRRLQIPAAWVAALVFALHPVNVMSVAWISERKNVLSLLFALLAALAFLRWDDTRKRYWYVCAVVSFALALLSKAAVVMLPVLLLCVWWRRGHVDRRDCVATIPFFALSLVMGLITIWFERQHGIVNEVVRTDNFAVRLLGAAWAIWFYIGKAVWPVNLAVIYPRWQIDVGTVFAWVPLLALVAIGAVCWKFRATWGRGVMFALGCFVVMLFPVLGFFNVAFMAYSFVADHWQYMALPSIIALACAGGAKVAARWRWFPAVAAAVVAALGFGTWRQTRVWRDEKSLWTDTLAKNPAAWMAHNNLGNVLLAQGRADEAATQYRETIRLKPDYGNAHYNLGIASFQRRDYGEAVNQFGDATRLKPQSAEAHNNLGAALVNVGRTNDAIAEFEIAVRLAPKWDEPRANLSRLR
jgi:Tfp pilus assembly protein PilF